MGPVEFHQLVVRVGGNPSRLNERDFTRYSFLASAIWASPELKNKFIKLILKDDEMSPELREEVEKLKEY